MKTLNLIVSILLLFASSFYIIGFISDPYRFEDYAVQHMFIFTASFFGAIIFWSFAIIESKQEEINDLRDRILGINRFRN